MKQVLILLYTSFIVVATSAQQTVKGKITDRETGAAIAGATISVNGAANITQTNEQGNFILHAIHL